MWEPKLEAIAEGAQHLRLGFDLAHVPRMAESIASFGDHFTTRFFTADELSYSQSGHQLQAERLAARFAAKEAVIKALSLSESGVSWRDIEVTRSEDGACGISLHGRVAEIARAMNVRQILLSMSHDGDYAGAVVQVVLGVER
jgi:holo-[acyl-carrier protein] synthase